MTLRLAIDRPTVERRLKSTSGNWTDTYPVFIFLFLLEVSWTGLDSVDIEGRFCKNWVSRIWVERVGVEVKRLVK